MVNHVIAPLQPQIIETHWGQLKSAEVIFTWFLNMH